MPYSPRSEAKKRGEHYFVKCRTYGYRCLNCDSCSPDIAAIKALKCIKPEAEARLEAEALAELRELKELEAEGHLLQDLLAQEQRELEAMMLEAEMAELERLLALEDQQIMQAKVLSLEEAAKASWVEASAPEASKRPHQPSEKALAATTSDAKRPCVEAPREPSEKALAATAGDAKRPCEAPQKPSEKVSPATTSDAKRPRVEAPQKPSEKALAATASDEKRPCEAPQKPSEKVLPATASDAKRPRVEALEEVQQTPEKVLPKRPRTSPDAETVAKSALLAGTDMPSGTGPLAELYMYNTSPGNQYLNAIPSLYAQPRT